MTRARMPRPHEVAAARRDPRLLRAFQDRAEDLTWRARGVCQSVDPEVFFPAPSEPADAAVALCRTCDVQGACLAWALEVGDCHGVWGATTPRERRAMLVAWRSDEFGSFDAFEAAAALRGPLGNEGLSAALNAPRSTSAASQDNAPKGRVPGQRVSNDGCLVNEPRHGADVRNGFDSRGDHEPRNSIDARNDIDARNGVDVCDGVGVAALA
jgi:WhiB family redox-sensing transcriptional regulator